LGQKWVTDHSRIAVLNEFSRQKAYYETKISQEIIFQKKALGIFYDDDCFYYFQK